MTSRIATYATAGLLAFSAGLFIHTAAQAAPAAQAGYTLVSGERGEHRANQREHRRQDVQRNDNRQPNAQAPITRNQFSYQLDPQVQREADYRGQRYRNRGHRNQYYGHQGRRYQHQGQRRHYRNQRDCRPRFRTIRGMAPPPRLDPLPGA